MKITSCTWICVLNLLLICFPLSVLTRSLFKHRQIYRGSRYRWRHGVVEESVWLKARINRPQGIALVQKSYHIFMHFRPYDFFNSKKKPCCTETKSQMMTQRRPADAACVRYQKIPVLPKRPPRSPMKLSIRGGVRASPGEFPSITALGYPASNEDEGAIRGIRYDICGGTLVSEKHIITAAHCVNNVQLLVPVEALLGTEDLSDPYSKGVQRIPISRIIKHPQHVVSLHYHDVAVVELQYSVRFSIYVYPTCLLTRRLPSLTAYADPSLHVVGWGAIDIDGTRSMKLMKVEGLKFVEETECWKSYENINTNIPNGLDDGMICVVDTNVTRRGDTCQGDSGGPLLISSSKFPLLAGVTSFGIACGGTAPSVYSSVYKYLNWIEDQVWPASNSIELLN